MYKKPNENNPLGMGGFGGFGGGFGGFGGN
jgi:hypothetical protein